MEKKAIAFYLPQFHAIPENDTWWGKGFTEWNNTKKAKPLYKGHVQPKVPLNDNYYCLLDADVQKWQSDLAQKYGVYGFCYYHYWFNGKLLLEKPMENMLKNAEITIPFCISWANETWARTWDGKEKEVLIQQKYGGKKDWERHIQYLLPFFKDARYIKIENRPVFLLYTSSRIDNCREMVKYWDKRLVEEGFAGIYILETLNSNQKEHFLDCSMGDVIFEPIFTWSNDVKKQDLFSKIKRYLLSHYGIGRLDKVDVRKIYQYIENRKYSTERKTYIGTVNAWDNSARKGRKGLIFTHTSPLEFEKHLRKLCEKEDTEEYIFINAWNEWGEGAYLEPDKENKYAYLEAVKNVLG